MNKKLKNISDYTNSKVPKCKGVKNINITDELKRMTGYIDISEIKNIKPFIISLDIEAHELNAGGYFIFTNSSGNKDSIYYNYSSGYYLLYKRALKINFDDYNLRASENLNEWIDKYIDNSQGNWIVEKITGLKIVDTIIKLTDIKNNKYIVLWYDYFLDNVLSKYQLLIN